MLIIRIPAVRHTFCLLPIAPLRSCSAYVDFGRFLTGSLVLTGLALPLVFSHAGVIAPAACGMSVAGGVLIYGTILVYARAFGAGEEDY